MRIAFLREARWFLGNLGLLLVLAFGLLVAFGFVLAGFSQAESIDQLPPAGC